MIGPLNVVQDLCQPGTFPFRMIYVKRALGSSNCKVQSVRFGEPIVLILCSTPPHSSLLQPKFEILDFPRFSGHRWLSQQPAVQTPQG